MNRFKVLFIASIFFSQSSCDIKAHKNTPIYNPPNSSVPEPGPGPGPEPYPNSPKPKDELVYRYKPDWTLPLYALAGDFYASQIELVDDYFRYLKEWISAWGESRNSEYIPTTFLSQWDGGIKYIDETEGNVLGIEKLKSIRANMLVRCPILAEPLNNSPLVVRWGSSESNTTGRFRPPGTTSVANIYHYDGSKETRYSGGISSSLTSTIWIFGKNSMFDYPKQTTIESGKPWGIDWTFVHEWGHHLMFSIDVNLGRTHYMTHELSESFASTVETVCAKPIDVRPDILESAYSWEFGKFRESRITGYKSKTEPLNGTQYNLRSMDSCITHEKYHGRFDSNTFVTALVDAYKRVEGRKLTTVPYPIFFSRGGGWVQAQWVDSLVDVPRTLLNNQPMLATRAEFLQRFLEVYDCGLANDHIQADMESKLKFEW